MLSRPLALFIAFVLSCSAFATYGQVGAGAPLASKAQIEALPEAAALEHAADGDRQQDEQGDASMPSQLEAGTDAPEGVPLLGEPLFGRLAAERPRPPAAAAWPAPTLDRLRRPPRVGLVAA